MTGLSPRMRGHLLQVDALLGPSPRGRGHPVQIDPLVFDARSIPAYAGSTSYSAAAVSCVLTPSAVSAWRKSIISVIESNSPIAVYTAVFTLTGFFAYVVHKNPLALSDY